MVAMRSLVIGLACGLVVSAWPCQAGDFEENFSSDPSQRGWAVHGDSSLFGWNVADGNLRVTWDSSHANSYYYHRLGTSLNRGHDFSFSFDLRLSDIAAGTTPDKPFAFQIALGLLNWSNAVEPGFLRGTGFSTPSLVEFNYFPDTGFGATVSPVMISSNNNFAYAWAYEELTPNDLFHVDMSYSATNETLRATVTRNGQAFATADAAIGTNFSDFEVDTLAICSYSDEGQDPAWDGSILAHGTVDNIAMRIAPPRTSGSISNQVWTAEFASLKNRVYALEATTDLKEWSTVSSAPGTGSKLRLQDADWRSQKFYRISVVEP